MRMESMELQHVVFETEEKGCVDAMWSDVRLHAGDIPNGWHCYAVRGGDGGWPPCSIEKTVWVNHAGDIITHDDLAGTARANLAAHDLEPGQEAYHLDSLHYATAEQMEAICPTGIDFDRYATLANGSVGYDEADAHWADAAWWDEQARAMWDEVDDIPDDGFYWTSVED